jgi:hypothetical protein
VSTANFEKYLVSQYDAINIMPVFITAIVFFIVINVLKISCENNIGTNKK